MVSFGGVFSFFRTTIFFFLLCLFFARAHHNDFASVDRCFIENLYQTRMYSICFNRFDV
jgi:hypothetical protein